MGRRRGGSYATEMIAHLVPLFGVREVKLIVVAIEIAGMGKNPSCMRRLYQLYTHEGELVAQYDPFEEEDE